MSQPVEIDIRYAPDEMLEVLYHGQSYRVPRVAIMAIASMAEGAGEYESIGDAIILFDWHPRDMCKRYLVIPVDDNPTAPYRVQMAAL